MPVSDIRDPVVLEIRRLRVQVKRLALASAVLYGVLAVAAAVAIYIRSSDLEDITRRTDRQTVRECFERSNSRPDLLDAALDPKVPSILRDLNLTLWENTPTIQDCRNLANQFHIGVEQEPR